MTILQYLLPVWTAYVLATASPGPSNMAIMGVAMERGRSRAFALVAGIVTGSITWALLAATGLSAILATYADAITIIRIVGGLYLLFLAYKSAKSVMTATIERIDVAASTSTKGYGTLYLNGLFLHLGNPKAIFTWISIMSLGVQPGMPSHTLPIMLGGSVLFSVTIFGAYALLFSSPPMVAIYRLARRWFEGAMAAFFAYAGLRLILTRS
jgi:threonine efflux protein